MRCGWLRAKPTVRGDSLHASHYRKITPLASYRMSIQVSCPGCKKSFNVDDKFAGMDRGVPALQDEDHGAAKAAGSQSPRAGDL